MTTALPKTMSSTNGPDGVAALRERMLTLREPERYRLLATLLADLADAKPDGADAKAAEEQAAALRKRVEELGEGCARLEDQLKEASDAKERKDKQLQLEQEQNQDSQRRLKDMRGQLEGVQREKQEIDTALVARNTEVHQKDREIDELRLRLQRAEHALNDTKRVEEVEKSRRALIVALEEKTREVEQVRGEKNVQIEAMKAEVLAAKGSQGVEAGNYVAVLWERLAKAKLVDGPVRPTPQSLERMFDAFVELTDFAHKCDEQTRPFLDRYTRGDENLRKAWEGFSRFALMLDEVKLTVAVTGGRPVGALRSRLGQLRRWMGAMALASDALVESTASALDQELRGVERGLKVEEFRKNGGPERVQDALTRLRREKLKGAMSG